MAAADRAAVRVSTHVLEKRVVNPTISGSSSCVEAAVARYASSPRLCDSGPKEIDNPAHGAPISAETKRKTGLKGRQRTRNEAPRSRDRCRGSSRCNSGWDLPRHGTRVSRFLQAPLCGLHVALRKSNLSLGNSSEHDDPDRMPERGDNDVLRRHGPCRLPHGDRTSRPSGQP